MIGKYISELRYPEVKALLNQDTIVMLPIGGGSKEHGDHLPMGTDMYVTQWVAQQVTERFPVLTLPLIPYSYFPAFVDFGGSVNIEAEHIIHYVKDVLLSFMRFGVKKFLLLDGGVSTRIPMQILCTTMNNDYGVKVALSNISGVGKEKELEVCLQKKGGHGDEAETSTMLYIRPELVDMSKAAEEYQPSSGLWDGGIPKVTLPMRMTTPHGINGNSTLATKEKGEAILQAYVDDIIRFLTEFQKLEVEERANPFRQS